jgi:uncharacterized damage-inducible protein DinB
MKAIPQIVEATQADLLSLHKLLHQLSDLQYQQKLDILSGASIGQHFRHILEFYSCALSSVTCGKLCYDERPRDQDIETKPSNALRLIEQIINMLYFVDTDILNQDLEMKTKLTETSESCSIKSSLLREFMYCVEHSIHHQALIKTGLLQLELRSLVDQNFGTAPSTLRYRRAHKARLG